MDIGNTIMIGDIILLILVAVFVVAGLAISLIAITLTSIKEGNGRTPQWPVSWPDSRTAVPRQRIGAESGQVILPPHQGAAPLRRADNAERVSLPQQGDAPSQTMSLPRQRVHRL
ncbi:hypothetical protein OG884_11160 [Streptosporangium sp. NBC_01755]|uniref:hypothetical protein n=1 Tax=unclassified Streptosporangium TaxID=2632669 RepID=UPI002DD7A90B|nr:MULTISPECIES: hypothetical protein [unclassified Streptosporangium]WSA26138.1 hypothetical protein OIE13_35515 [Streptosporangium sp. NBC_01810]WSD02432.1 hypothetical protein OG884_11160 [Streptosporangium sp. NBC_01755]